MNALNIVFSIFVIVALAACSTPSGGEGKSFDYKAPPVKAPSLEVPPDLTTFSGDDKYAIPGEGAPGTRYSEFSKSGANLKADQPNKTSNVLPPVKNVRLESEGTQRWLVVNDTAENIWPVVKEFWQTNGFTIKIDNPQAGIIETDWVESRAKIPVDPGRKVTGNVPDGLYSSGERDQYHTRLQRSKDGSSTEIYITHNGMQQIAECDGNGYRWLPRPADPEPEATMLQLLMSKLGGGSGVLETAQNSTIVPVTAGTGAAPKLNKLADGSQSILLGEPFDKSWRKVGLALEKAGIVPTDKDRSKGMYFLSAGKDDSKSKHAADKVARIQVNVREISSGCEVVVNTEAGVSNADTQKIVDSLYKSLVRL